MIPTVMNTVEENDGLLNDFEYETQPDYTYKLNIEAETVAGYVEGLKAYEQAIYKILNTERYAHIIYSWNYGVEYKDLFGQPIAYVIPELERRTTEAVIAYELTESVGNFEFETPEKGVVHMKFKATSIYGEVEFNKTVEI